MDRRRFLRVAAPGTVLIGLSGCLDGSARAGDSTWDIGMSTRVFRPEHVTVQPGATVVWRNTSTHSHTVTAYEDRIPGEAAYFATGGYATQQAAEEGWRNGGGALEPHEEYEYTFDALGTYHYYCIPHEASGMVGTVTVSEEV